MSGPVVKHYIISETIISTLFNSAFSFGFTYLFFKSQTVIDRQALIIDAMPQSFFVTFFGVLMPTLITRHRLRKGKMLPMGARQWRVPRNPLLRAIASGLLMAAAGTLVHYAVLHGFNLEEMGLNTVLAYKTLYGAALTWIVTPLALHVVLNEPVAKS